MKVASEMTLKLAVLVSAVPAIAGEPSWPRWTELPAQICVERPENNGVLNIREVDVVIERGPALSLMGGQAACVFVDVGKHTLWIQSRNPYDPASVDPKAWKSAPITVDVKRGERVELQVCGEGARSTYTGWSIRQTNGRCE